MFLRSNNRKKDGKDHRYFSILSDRTTLRGFLDKIENTYGKAKRLWVMRLGAAKSEAGRAFRFV